MGLNDIVNKAKSNITGSANKVNDTLSTFDNKVSETKKSGLSKLKSLKDMGSNMLNKMGDIGKSIASNEIKLFNQLKGFGSKFGLSGILGKLGGMFKGLMGGLLDSFKQMISETMKTLENVATNFVGNLVEDIYNDIKKFLYIPDIVYSKTLEGLFYASGTDLAYKNHYIRTQALKRDWVYTLKFIDNEEAYNITYDENYSKLKSDLTSCAKNGAWHNVEYILVEVSKRVARLQAEANEKLALTKSYDPKSAEYKAYYKVYDQCTKNINNLSRTIIEYSKFMIVYSYSNFSAEDCKSVINNINRQGISIIVPKYYGITDDKYSKKYNFTSSDIVKMMPEYKPTLSITDKKTIENTQNENELLESDADDLAISISTKKKAANAKDATGDYSNGAKDRTKAIMDKYRAKSMKTRASNNNIMTRDALAKGSGAVLADTRARYPSPTPKGALKDVVKYKKWNDLSVTKLGNALFDTTDYISLRNTHIKSIYVMLTSKTIWNNDVMVNEAFYERCKIPTMTNTMSAIDKAKGLLGSSALWQGVIDLGDAQDGLAYNYTKSISKFLFTPGVNNDYTSGSGWMGVIKSYGMNYSEGDYELPSIESNTGNSESNPDSGETIEPGTRNDYQVSSNTQVNKQTEENINKDSIKKLQLNNLVRFLNNLSMIEKRDFLEKYLSSFYTCMTSKNISSETIELVFSELNYSIFGKNNIKNLNDLGSVFSSSSNESLFNNIKTLMSFNIMDSNIIVSVIGLNNQSKDIKELIMNIFKAIMFIASYDLKEQSFRKTVYTYDDEHFKSILKQKYNSNINHLKVIANPDHKMHKMFWNIKDSLSKNFPNFDKSGIIGYDNKVDLRVQYTNIIAGDWKSIYITKDGDTLFGGDDNTEKNGIMYLGSDNNVTPTKVTTGSWEIKDLNGNVFFIDDIHDDMYLWDERQKSPVLISHIDNIKDYEFFSDESTKLIAMLSKSNNGIKIWNKYYKRFDTSIANVGGNWTIKLTRSGLLFFSKTVNSRIYLARFSDNDANFIVVNDNSKIWSDVVEAIGTVTVTSITTTPSSGGSSSGSTTPPAPVISTEYINHFIATDNNSNTIYDMATPPQKTKSVFSSNYTATTFTNIISSNETKNYIFIITDSVFILTSREIIKLIIEPGTSTVTNGISSGLTTSTRFTISTIIRTTANTTNTFVYYFSEDNYGLFYSEDNVDKNTSVYKYFNGNNTSNFTSNDIPNHKNFKYKIILDNLFIFDTTEKIENIYHFSISNRNFTNIFTDESMKVPGWDYDIVDNKIFWKNTKTPMGITGYNFATNKVIRSNVINGLWKICDCNNKYVILSSGGTNKGIMVSSSKNTLSFSYPTMNPIKYYDFSGNYYDFDRGILFIGTYRRDITKFDTSLLKYDIEEFLYTANVWTMNNICKNISETMVSNILKFVMEYIANLDDSNSDITEAFKELMTDLLSSIGLMNEELEKSISSSSFYQNMVFEATAAAEFDMDDNNALNNILSSILSNDIMDNINNFNALLRYEETNRIIIVYNTPKDFEENIDKEGYRPGETEWNKRFESTSIEYLQDDGGLVPN